MSSFVEVTLRDGTVERKRLADGRVVPQEMFEWQNIVQATIPRGVEIIERKAFASADHLANVTFPDTLVAIEERAFEDCLALDNVFLPNSVTQLGHSVFEGCKMLSTISISDNVETIEDGVFGKCESLKSVKFPARLRVIEWDAFEWCTSLASVVFPETLETIKQGAFFKCKSLKAVTLPASTKRVYNNAFESCDSLTHVFIKNRHAVIDCDAFKVSYNIQRVNIHDSVRVAFYDETGELEAKIFLRASHYHDGEEKEAWQFLFPELPAADIGWRSSFVGRYRNGFVDRTHTFTTVASLMRPRTSADARRAIGNPTSDAILHILPFSETNI